MDGWLIYCNYLFVTYLFVHILLSSFVVLKLKNLFGSGHDEVQWINLSGFLYLRINNYCDAGCCHENIKQQVKVNINHDLISCLNRTELPSWDESISRFYKSSIIRGALCFTEKHCEEQVNASHVLVNVASPEMCLQWCICAVS